MPFATATSICRSKLTICSGVCFFPFAMFRSFLYSLSHENWYIKGRALQFVFSCAAHNLIRLPRLIV